MAEGNGTVTITVEGPRASGVTQTVQHIRQILGNAGLQTHKGLISYVIRDASSGEQFNV